MKILFLSLLALLTIGHGTAQQKYASPVDFSIRIAGNVGEIRGTHFHTGIDIKALKGIGSKIFAISDGYISRIGVSPTGYGNVLYVNHPNGESSVYAHLDGFAPQIAEWVKAQQYSKRSFRVNLYPPRELFTVKAGDVIGYMGNSGSSGGPHLHFEIRNKNSQPLNIARDTIYDIPDYSAPVLFSVTLYECEMVQGVREFFATDTLVFNPDEPTKNPTLSASRPFYLAYEVIDYKYGAPNTMGIYSLNQSVDGVQNFGFEIKRLDFGFGKYVQTFTQYDLNKNSKYHVLRAYKSENNGFPFYNNLKSRGIIPAPQDGKDITIETALEDDAGNISVFDFKVVYAPAQRLPVKGGEVVRWKSGLSFNSERLRVEIPPLALYDDKVIAIDTTGDNFSIGEWNTPLHKSMAVSLKTDDTDPKKHRQALFYNTRTRGVTKANYDSGRYEGELSALGQYTIKYDATAPKVTANAPKNGKLTFTVSDNLSGIRYYELRIDGQWALGEWDPKTRSLTYRYKPSGKEHSATLYVEDYCGNGTREEITVKL